MIINPGSENKGGTFKRALEIAKEWHVRMLEEFPEVTMTTHEKRLNDGDWEFQFNHGITGKTILLQTHGFTKEECERFVFNPRIYWNDSSTSEPSIEDWLTDEFTYTVRYSLK